MATIAANTSENVDFCLTCAPTVEAAYLRCGFARTPPLDPKSSEQCAPERDSQEMALAEAALCDHLSRAGGSAPCCPDRALHCRVCELHILITAEAATLLRAAGAEDSVALFPVHLNHDDRPKLWASSGELVASE